MGLFYKLRESKVRRDSMPFRAVIICLQLLGAIIVSAGVGMVFVPAGIILAGAFMIAFAVAIERN
jgi:uncharacterized membrane protein